MAIDKLILDIEKTFGKGSVILGDNLPDVEKISTGVLSLDIATGGGYGLGRIVEVMGEESVGKTLISIYGMIESQKMFPNKYVGIVDAEHAFDINWAEKLGLDTDRLIISQPDNGEQGLEILERMASSGDVSFILVDSVAALTPKAEIEGEMGDNQMGLHARLMGKAMRKITGIVSKHNCVVIFTNQKRMKLGVMFGDPTTTTGGNALKFAATQRIDLSRSQGSKNDDGTLSSNKIKAKVIKNKIAVPFQVAEYEVVFGEGISKEKEVLDLGVNYGFIIKSGTWYKLENGTTLGQGEKAKEFLKDNPDLTDLLIANIKDVALNGAEKGKD